MVSTNRDGIHQPPATIGILNDVFGLILRRLATRRFVFALQHSSVTALQYQAVQCSTVIRAQSLRRPTMFS
ncbi:MAG: hypothetical protein WBB88_12435, partial [Methyloceanibacter sp.]